MDRIDNTRARALDMRPTHIEATEWEARLELSACYRLFDWMGWAESIYNHITLRVPGRAPGEEAFLINPYGLHYVEVTASNLVKIDVDGRKLDDSPWPVNPAGFVIHSAVHRARPDAHCVMHTHTTAGMAVACKEGGLRADNFYSAALHGLVAYHDFEGITTDAGEQPRLVASLGDREVLILRNHGLLTLGPHVPGAFGRMWSVQRACEVQLAADAMAGPNRAVPPEVLARIPGQLRPMAQAAGAARRGELPFEALLRRAGIAYTDLI
ncbi:MAG: class II aldolase/adducin family protein [Burkholderiaceae bacterium]|nr:class II aldolase/adducin family protein [Burkholderiaceae bacterium]